MFLYDFLIGNQTIPERQVGVDSPSPEDLLKDQPLVSGPARVIVILTMTRRSRRMASR